MRYMIVVAALGVACAASAQEDTSGIEETTAEESAGVAVCLSVPRVSASSSAPVVSGFSEALREEFTAFLRGPLLDPRPLAARLPAQAKAEAAQLQCKYILNVALAHVPNSKIGRRTAQAAMTVGSAAESFGALSETASSGLSAASTLGGLFGGGDAAAVSGMYPVGKNDQLTIQYVIELVDKKGTLKNGNLTRKVSRDGEPVLEQLIELAATEIIDATTTSDH